jgi:GNAT superfamily N-acetyltransferase
MSLHVRRTLHRKGIGRMLVSATAASLAARGCSAMMLWVLEANPARAFYEHLGATLLEGHRLFIGVPEVPYGWSDIRTIASLVDGGDS